VRREGQIMRPRYIDCEQTLDCQLGVALCGACRLNDIENRAEAAQLRAEQIAELEEEEDT
jgi:hypothetical protein